MSNETLEKMIDEYETTDMSIVVLIRKIASDLAALRERVEAIKGLVEWLSDWRRNWTPKYQQIVDKALPYLKAEVGE
jgi:hypothetical protein